MTIPRAPDGVDLRPLTVQESDLAERAYYNVPSFMRQYFAAIQRAAPESGENLKRESDSNADRASRGAKNYLNDRINALRERRANETGAKEFEAFDPKNLGNANNVSGWPTAVPTTPYRGSGTVAAYRNQDYGALDAASLDKSLQDEIGASQNAQYNLQQDYTTAAQKAGTYSDTEEFKRGLGDEVTHGTRGTQIVALDRINAIRSSQGLPPVQFIHDALQGTSSYVAPQAPPSSGAAPQTINTAPTATPTQSTDVSSLRAKTGSVTAEPATEASTTAPTISNTSPTFGDNAVGSAEGEKAGTPTPATGVEKPASPLLSGVASRMRALKARKS